MHYPGCQCKQFNRSIIISRSNRFAAFPTPMWCVKRNVPLTLWHVGGKFVNKVKIVVNKAKKFPFAKDGTSCPKCAQLGPAGMPGCLWVCTIVPNDVVERLENTSNCGEFAPSGRRSPSCDRNVGIPWSRRATLHYVNRGVEAFKALIKVIKFYG